MMIRGAVIASRYCCRQRQQQHLNASFVSANSEIDSTTRRNQQTRLFASEDNDDRRKTALILGSSGALGSLLARYLSVTVNMRVLGADLVELPAEVTGDWELDGFIRLPRDAVLHDLTLQLTRGVHYYAKDDGLDAVICCSGGWQGDDERVTQLAGDRSSLESMEKAAIAYMDRTKAMKRQNLDPVLAASFIVQHYMRVDHNNQDHKTLFCVLGATAALGPTPGMMGYGLAKAASHHLIQTLGACTGNNALYPKSIRTAGNKVRQHLPALDDMDVIGLLPTTIDTAANRRAMPQADFSQWTKPQDIAQEIGKWIEQPDVRPHSGSLVKVHPKAEGGGASFELAR